MASEERFHHLLQPLRDLAGNWNINIANELGDYLEVLEEITFSFQKGQSMNFAQAAMVIQGSACIYSKKVEYLHSLVYQALEFVTDRKVKALRSKGTAAEADDENEFDDEEHFLCLDDGLEEGTGLDLVEDDYDAEGDGYMDEVLLSRLPATLLALEDTGMGDGDAGNYRLASCAIHHSGALLLEARDGYMLDEHLRPIHSNAAFGWVASTVGAAVENVQADAVGAAQNGDDFGNDDTGGDYFHDDDDYQMDANNSPWGAPPPAAPEGLLQPPKVLPAPAEEEEDEEEFDPYKPLDPGAASGITVKPFKKMSRIAKKPRMRAAHQEAPTHILTDGIMSMPAPATGLLFPEFNYALNTQQEKEKSVKKSKARQELACVFTLADAEALAATTALEEAEMNDDDGNNANNDDDNGYFDDHFDDMGCDIDDFEDIVAAAEAAKPAGGGGLLTDVYYNAPIGNSDDGGGDISYEDLCRAYVESLISAAAAAEVQTELASRVSTWRSKMAPVLEEEDARPDFDIHVYGSRILQGMAGLSVSEKGVQYEVEEEERADEEIDVDDDNEVSAIHFDQVVATSHTKNGYDVPRVFSSMLQLVNNGNLRITKIRDCADNFSIQLLSTELKHQRIEDYRAPSAIEAVEGTNSDDNAMNEVRVQEPERKNGNGGRRGRTAVGAENENEKKTVAATAPTANKRRKA